jgi:hypothetical protein
MTSRFANARKAIVPRLIKSVGGRGPAFGRRGAGPAVLARTSGDRAPGHGRGGQRRHRRRLSPEPARPRRHPDGGQDGHGPGRAAMASGSRKSNVWALKDHNLFVAFAPVDEPRYAVAVIIEHGGKGGATAAAPRARRGHAHVLLKDPEMLERIQRPAAARADRSGTDEGIEAIGAAPDPDHRRPRRAPAPRLRPRAVRAAPLYPGLRDDRLRPDPSRRARPDLDQDRRDRLAFRRPAVRRRRGGRSHAVFGRRRLVGAMGRQTPDPLRRTAGGDAGPVDGAPEDGGSAPPIVYGAGC